VIDDSPAGAHAAPGDDHRGAGPLDQPEMVPVGTTGVKPVEIERMVAPLQEGPGFPVPVGGKGGGDPGQFEAEGGIHHHGNASEAIELRHGSPEGEVGDQPVQFVEQFLGAAEGESGDEDLAAVNEGAPEDLSEPFEPMLAAFVKAVAVGGFEHQQIARRRRFGVRQERGIPGAEVPGKDDGPGRIVTVQMEEGRPQNMPGLMKRKANALLELSLRHIRSPSSTGRWLLPGGRPPFRPFGRSSWRLSAWAAAASWWDGSPGFRPQSLPESAEAGRRCGRYGHG